MFLLGSSGSKQSLRLPSVFLTGTIELVHSVSSSTGVIPSLHSHWSSSLYAVLILNGTDQGGVGLVHSPSWVWHCMLFLAGSLLHWRHNCILLIVYSLVMGSLVPFPIYEYCTIEQLDSWMFQTCDPSSLLPCASMILSSLFSGVCMLLGLLYRLWWGNLWKMCIYPICCTVSLPRIRYHLGVCDLECSLPWCLTPCKQYGCAQPFVSYCMSKHNH